MSPEVPTAPDLEGSEAVAPGVAGEGFEPS